jgi:hypothetical protein
MARPGPAAGFCEILHPKKRAFLVAYSRSGLLVASCDAARISHQLHAYWLKTDPDYTRAFAEARAMVADILEDEALRRAVAVEGASDTLLIFLLKGARPDVYKERYEHTGKDGGPIQVDQMAPDARQARLAALLAKRNGAQVPIMPDPGGAS